jgi:hypothetical protein
MGEFSEFPSTHAPSSKAGFGEAADFGGLQKGREGIVSPMQFKSTIVSPSSLARIAGFPSPMSIHWSKYS